MKFYLITFKEFDYGQYSDFVVVAINAKQAIIFLKKSYPDENFEYIDWKGGYKIKELKAEFINMEKNIIFPSLWKRQ